MKLGRIGTFWLILFAIGIILPMAVISQTSGTYWRNFRMTVPEEVSAEPGQTLTINASILNTGRYWLRDFNITLEGLPSDYSYTVTPSHWDELRILRDWNPQDGVFKVPESFLITIKVPAGASGLHAVTVNGTEHASMYLVSNTTQFVLKVSGEAAKPEISDLSIPEVVYKGEAFDVSYRISNPVSGELAGTGKLLVPENWAADPANRSVTLKTNESMVLNFSVTAASNVGFLTAVVEYPYGNETFNVTKESGSVIPIDRITGTGLGTGLGGLGTSISGLFGGLQSYSPLLITIIVVIILVIAWIVWSVFGMYGKQRRPERVKKQVEINSLPEAA